MQVYSILVQLVSVMPVRKLYPSYDIEGQEIKPANPRAEGDLSFFVLEALSNVCPKKPRKFSHVLLNSVERSGRMPKGSKTELSELRKRNYYQVNYRPNHHYGNSIKRVINKDARLTQQNILVLIHFPG